MVLDCLSEEVPFKWKPASYTKVNHVKIWAEETARATEQQWEWTQLCQEWKEGHGGWRIVSVGRAVRDEAKKLGKA